MIDEFDMYLAVQREEISYYDFQKWCSENIHTVDEELWNSIYDKGYKNGSDDNYSQGYNDGLEDGKLG